MSKADKNLLQTPGVKRLRLQPVQRLSPTTTYEFALTAALNVPALEEQKLVDYFHTYQTMVFKLTNGTTWTPELRWHVQVSGLCYVGVVTVGGQSYHMRTPQDTGEYWRELASKRLGAHLYLCRNGRLYFATVRLEKVLPSEASAKQKQLAEQAKQTKFYQIGSTEPAPIHGAYPAIRFEFETKPPGQPWYDPISLKPTNVEVWDGLDLKGKLTLGFKGTHRLTLGLAFKFYAESVGKTGSTSSNKSVGKSGSQPGGGPGVQPIASGSGSQSKDQSQAQGPVQERDYQRGDRFYHREVPCNAPATHGQVWELTDATLRERLEGLDAGRQRWAIYVGVGAKLLVTDAYNEKQSNRNSKTYTLCQMGAVVAGEGVLNLEGPAVNLMNQMRGPPKLAVAGGVLKPLGTGRKATYEAVNEPVLFLAAHDSEHGSSAWHLIVEHLDQKVEQRQYRLVMPEAGVLAGMEEWRQGVDEIYARHRYEQLHRSVCQMDPTVDYMVKDVSSFAVPTDQNILTRILGLSQKNDQRRELVADVPTSLPEGSYAAAWLQNPDYKRFDPLPVRYWGAYQGTNLLPPTAKKQTQPLMVPEWPLFEYSLTPVPEGQSTPKPTLSYHKHTAPPVLGPHPDPAFNSMGQYLYAENPQVNKKYKYELAKERQPWFASHVAKQPFDHNPADKCTGQGIYVGVDGWLYRPDPNLKVAQYTAQYYHCTKASTLVTQSTAGAAATPSPGGQKRPEADDAGAKAKKPKVG